MGGDFMIKHMKKVTAALLASALTLSFAATVFAAKLVIHSQYLLKDMEY